MHVGVDGSFWGGAERGVAVATRRLFIAMARARSRYRLTGFISERSTLPADVTRPGGPVSLVWTAQRVGVGRVLWNQWTLPRLLAQHGVDLLYAPSYTLPLSARVPCVLTVHDLIAWKRPELCQLTNLVHLRALLAESVRRAARITVPTETVRDDLTRILGAPASKVHVVPWGADLEIEWMSRTAAADLVRARFGVEVPFVLFAGCLEPKKDLRNVLHAAARAGAMLVVTGAPGFGLRREVRLLVDRRGRAGRYLGYVTARELSALYACAEAFVFPSHIEGFGLPVVEAMRCGAPVVTSDAPALREVCGGAALHVPAGDEDALAGTLRGLLSDAALRDDLVNRGRAQTASMTWARAAEAMIELFDDVAGTPRSSARRDAPSRPPSTNT